MKKIMKEIFFNNIGLTYNFAELIEYQQSGKQAIANSLLSFHSKSCSYHDRNGRASFCTVKVLHLAGYFHCIDVGLAIRFSSEDVEAPVRVAGKQQLQLITFEGFAEVCGLQAADFPLEIERSS